MHNGLRITEIRLAFPPDGVPSGGEMRYVRTLAGADVGAVVTVPLEPGEPDTLDALTAWCKTRLGARGVMPADAAPATPKKRVEPTAPAAEPGVRLG